MIFILGVRYSSARSCLLCSIEGHSECRSITESRYNTSPRPLKLASFEKLLAGVENHVSRTCGAAYQPEKHPTYMANELSVSSEIIKDGTNKSSADMRGRTSFSAHLIARRSDQPRLVLIPRINRHPIYRSDSPIAAPFLE